MKKKTLKNIFLFPVFVVTILSGCSSERKIIQEFLSRANSDIKSVKNATIAIVELPQRQELAVALEKERPPKPTLDKFNNKFTPEDGRYKDLQNKEWKRPNEHLEFSYTAMSEEERIQQRKKLLNDNLRAWEHITADGADKCLKEIDMCISHLSTTKEFQIVDKSRIDAIIAEHQAQQSFWASNENLAEVGRVLNAQYLVFVNAIPTISEYFTTYGTNWHINFEFVQVSTFQKIVITANPSRFPTKSDVEKITEAAYLDSEKNYLTKMITGNWLCRGVMTNGIVYTKKTKDYFSPFSAGHPLKKVSKIPKEFNLNMDMAKFTISDKHCTVLQKDKETECEVIYNPEDFHFWGPERSISEQLDRKQSLDNFTEVDGLRKEYTNHYIGYISIISYETGFIIEGKVFRNSEGLLAIHLGSVNKKKDGPHYFLVMSKL